MAKEDNLLREEMEKLEIEPVKLNRGKSEENPFVRHYKRCLPKRTSVFRNRSSEVGCSCNDIKKSVNNGICKRKHNKLLKEPVLAVLKTCIGHRVVEKDDGQDTVAVSYVNTESLNLCTLVSTCNQLKISNGLNIEMKNKNVIDLWLTKWWKNEVKCAQESTEQRYSNQAGSCSQALNPQCDITIDELASYFETLVHIPKKMSSMAEMMYI